MAANKATAMMENFIVLVRSFRIIEMCRRCFGVKWRWMDEWSESWMRRMGGWIVENDENNSSLYNFSESYDAQLCDRNHGRTYR